MLRDAGAKEVHMRISSPMFLNPCYYGIDIPSSDELFARKYSREEMRDIIGADSLEFFRWKDSRILFRSLTVGIAMHALQAIILGEFLRNIASKLVMFDVLV